MNLLFTPDAWDDYLHWQRHDRKILNRINALIKEVMRSPFDGVGKPEPLRHQLHGCGSRRITQEHRLVYEVTDRALIIIACRFHY